MKQFSRPDWIPRVEAGARILITGASGGLGTPLVKMLLDGSECVIGAHGATKDTGIDVDTKTKPAAD